jgi:hypothetical protein
MKTIKFSLILLAFMAFAQTTWAQSNSSELPCLPSHGETDDVSAWCGGLQEIVLSAGWNWVSFYVEADDLLEQLETSLGESGLEIWNSEVGTQYYPDFGWYGDLDDIGMNNSETYLVKTSAACEVVLVGERANPTLHTITINPGWNWIGYPCAETMTVEEALSGFVPEGGDKIVNSDDYTEYYPDFGWWGDVETFNPGRGYMYYSASSVTKTITFTAATRGIRRTNP